MKGKFLRSLLALAASAVLAVSTVPVKADDTVTTSSSSQIYTGYLENVQYHQTKARAMFTYVNDFRTAGNAWVWNEDGTTKTENIKKDELEYDYGLEEIAMQRAAEIAVYWDHTRPNGTPWYTCRSSAGENSWAENIAYGYDNTGLTFDLWKEENMGYDGQGHRRNMLGDYQAIGIACAEVNGEFFWVQEFGYKSSVSDPGASESKVNVDMSIAQNLIARNGGYYSSADTMTVNVGDTVDIPPLYFTARLKDVLGDPFYETPTVQLTGGVRYTVSDSSTASIKGDTITGKKIGTCRLTGHLGSQTFDVNLNVVTKGAVAMYRLYNPNSSEHFYTSDEAEKNKLVSLGWHDENIGWYAPTSSNTPVYRLYNQAGGEHHYTYDVEERNHLISIGWKYEGIGWYSDDAKSVPLYRQYNPNMFANNHNYTADTEERDYLLSLGWHDENIGWYGVNEK